MESAAEVRASLLASLTRAFNDAYYKHPIPSEIDRRLSGVISDLASLGVSEREAIVNELEFEHGRILGLFAERMASLAVREKAVTLLKNRLIALVIHSRTDDLREILLILSLLHDAAIRIEDSAQRTFEEVASLFSDTGFLSGFLNRSEEDKSIAAMGYKASADEGGFLYVRTW